MEMIGQQVIVVDKNELKTNGNPTEWIRILSAQSNHIQSGGRLSTVTIRQAYNYSMGSVEAPKNILVLVD